MVAFDGFEVSENGLFEACGQHRVAVLARIGKVSYDPYSRPPKKLQVSPALLNGPLARPPNLRAQSLARR